MRSLVDERRCQAFFQRVLGLTNFFDKMATRFDDPSQQIAVSEMLYFNPKYDKKELLAYVDDPSFCAAFARFYPTFVHLVDAARELIADCDELHAVRQRIIEPHLGPDRTKILRERLHVSTFSLPERAAMNGLTPAQQQHYESEIDREGYRLLSMSERRLVSNAIRDRVSA